MEAYEGVEVGAVDGLNVGTFEEGYCDSFPNAVGACVGIHDGDVVGAVDGGAPAVRRGDPTRTTATSHRKDAGKAVNGRIPQCRGRRCQLPVASCQLPDDQTMCAKAVNLAVVARL